MAIEYKSLGEMLEVPSEAASVATAICKLCDGHGITAIVIAMGMVLGEIDERFEDVTQETILQIIQITMKAHTDSQEAYEKQMN